MEIFKKKINKDNKTKTMSGVTYIELIVVLSIFSIMSAILIFNYQGFQSKVDIKNLANDIALQIIQAQKLALSGQETMQIPTVSPWKPAYGVYFNLASNKSFTYFVDLNNNDLFDGASCTSECLNTVSITKNNTIAGMSVFYQDGSSASLNDLTVVFTRPNSGASIQSSQIIPPLASPVSYAQINIVSPSGIPAAIKVYAAGRIQIN